MLWLLALAVAATLPSYTIYHVTIHPDGSASWVIEHRFPLASPEEAEAFDATTATLGNFTEDYRERIEAVVSKASQTLRREMRVEEFSVAAESFDAVSGKMGLIRVEFVWHGFARVSDSGEVVVGDVFVGGFYLSEGESLRFKIPAGYEVWEARPQPDTRGSDYVEWRGRMVFSDSEPQLVIRHSTPPISDAAAGWVDGGAVLLFAAGGTAASAAVAYALHRARRRRTLRRSELDTVLSIIRRHGGVVYQSQIVRESGLSKSTVSTVLKVLESEGRIMRIREGRENIVKLAR